MPQLKDRPWIGPNTIMLKHKFSKEQMRRWQIWAARWRECPKCGADPYTPCINQADVKAKVPVPRHTQYPHIERVDYDLLTRGLYYRGYW